jgi:hypothetical protein
MGNMWRSMNVRVFLSGCAWTYCVLAASCGTDKRVVPNDGLGPSGEDLPTGFTPCEAMVCAPGEYCLIAADHWCALGCQTGANCPQGFACQDVTFGVGMCRDASGALVCGDGVCSGVEWGICPIDCPDVCGDFVCDAGETASCPSDCSGMATCGNGICDSGEFGICAADCHTTCGNGVCEAGEIGVCAIDCPGFPTP